MKEILIDLQSQNIFKITHPDNWICSAQHFSNGHNILKLELKSVKEKSRRLYLRFRKVRYFTGWMNWTGANFHVGSDDDCYTLLNQTVCPEYQITREVYKFSNLRLFQVKGVDGKHIQIIENAVGCEDVDGNILSGFPIL